MVQLNYENFIQFLRFFKFNSYINDNAVFRLHYLFMATLLGILSIICTTRQLGISDPVYCYETDFVNVNEFCWQHGTFTIPQVRLTNGTLIKPRVGEGRHDVPFAGISKEEDNQRVYQHYYGYVPVMLAVQAAIFYFPRGLWKSIEAGRVQSLVSDLKKAVVDPNDQKQKIEALIKYMKQHIGHHTRLYHGFIFCELLNFLNVIGQILAIDHFLGSRPLSLKFIRLGFDTAQYYITDGFDSGSTSPLQELFPRMAKCIFRKYGRSGRIFKRDAICMLNLNYLHEKIYIFLWVSLAFLLIVSTIVLVYRFIFLVFPRHTKCLLKLSTSGGRKEDVKVVYASCDNGDWFFIRMLAKNMNVPVFSDFMSQLVVEILRGGLNDQDDRLMAHINLKSSDIRFLPRVPNQEQQTNPLYQTMGPTNILS